MANDKHAVNDDPPTPPDIEWTAMTRAVAQVVLGDLMIMAGIGSIAFHCYLGTVSTGIWVGAVVLATGLVGVVDAARYSYSVRFAYSVMLTVCMCLSLILVAIEVTAFLVDRQQYTDPAASDVVRGVVATRNYTLSRNGSYTNGSAPIECVYLHESLTAFGVADFVGAVVCIYYTGSYLAIRYKSMKV